MRKEEFDITFKEFYKLVEEFGTDKKKYEDYFNKLDKESLSMKFTLETGKGEIEFIFYYRFTEMKIKADPEVEEELIKHINLQGVLE